MSTIAELLVKLGIDSSEFQSGVSEATTSTGGLSKAFGLMGGIGKVAMAGVGVGMVAMGGFLAYATKEAMEAQDIQAQLGAVLKSTGGAAGVTADMANQLADSLSQVTRFSDEAVLEGENLLLTFTNIGKDVFPDATATMLDMSTAMGQDLSASAMQLGKALQDPINGVTALKRVGVNFTESQIDMIKAMVETGDVAGAQAIILQELQKEFGGSAEAAGSTFAGQLDILRNSMSNVAEGVGAVLLPAMTELVQEFGPMILQFAKDLAQFVQSDQFKQWISDTVAWIKNDLIPAIIQAAGWFKNDFIPAVQAIWAVAGPILGFLGTAFRVLWSVEIAGFIGFIKNQVNAIKGFFQLFEDGKNLMITVKDKLKDVFNEIKTTITTVLSAIRDFASQKWEEIKGIFSRAVDSIKQLFSINVWITIGKNIVEGIAEGIGRFAGILWSAITNLANQIIDKIKTALGVTHSPSELMKPVGRDLVMGLAIGIADMATAATNVAKSVAQDIAESLVPVLPETMGGINADISAAGNGIGATASAPSSGPDINTTLELLMAQLDRMPENLARAVRDNLILVSQ